MTTAVATTALPKSLLAVLEKRGFVTEEARDALLNPKLSALGSPSAFSHMEVAVNRLLKAIQQEEPIAIYADRDVDGLTGLAILARSLRTLGAPVMWGNPVTRGLDHRVIEGLASKGAKVLVFVDCGVGENEELAWLASQGIDVIVADHHRLPPSAERAKALAYIHPGVMEGKSEEKPAGCVMAFKLAQAMWCRFLGDREPQRMDYFLFDHLDLLCLGILADRMPVTGENRILVWHGLRRLAITRKAGLASLLRFFRLTPRQGPVTVREATWQIIPMLNAAGRMGRPEVAAQLLLTEDSIVARECIDTLLELNTQRRAHQEKSLDLFERVVIEQCTLETDSVLIALARDLEPSVTGLAAQALVRKYNRPTFLFVNQGEESVGSGRGLDDADLYALIEEHKDLLIRFGGHQGAVGLTIKTTNFTLLRERLLKAGARRRPLKTDCAKGPEASMALAEADEAWWLALQRLEPFGPGFLCPVFELQVESLEPTSARKKPSTGVRLVSGGRRWRADYESEPTQTLDESTAGPWSVQGYPVLDKKEEIGFRWVIQEVRQAHG